MEIKIEFFSQQIKNLREAKSLTQEELAHDLGVSRQSIIAIERGKCLPSLPLALSLAETFDLALENFFNPEVEEKSNKNELRKEVKNMPRDLMPFSPFRDLNLLHENIDRLFEESLPTLPRATLVPEINVYEKDNSIIVEADIPGVKEEDLSIEVGADHISLSGKRQAETEIKEENYYRRETSYGSFSRTIALPVEIDKDKAEAELRNGILSIHLPKKTEVQSKVNKIKVKTK